MRHENVNLRVEVENLRAEVSGLRKEIDAALALSSLLSTRLAHEAHRNEHEEGSDSVVCGRCAQPRIEHIGGRCPTPLRDQNRDDTQPKES